MRVLPATFDDQLAILAELQREVDRMERVEKRHSKRRTPGGYERELRLAGLAQRVAQAYTIIEGVLGFVARRIDRVPVTGADWHKQLVARSSRPFGDPQRPALIPEALARELLELCEFRHVVRNIYPTHLDDARVRENLQRLIRATRAFSAEASGFAVRQSTAPRPGPGRASKTTVN